MIDKKEVKHVAALARIGTDDQDLEKFSKDLSAVLDWVGKLQEVDLENIEPIDHIVGIKNISRSDKSKECQEKEDIIKLFPDKKNRFVKVKSVL